MVLSDNLDSLIFKENEVFNIINQSFLVQKTIHKVSDGAILDMICRKNGFSVQFFFFTVNLEPFKEIVIGRIECAQLRFQTIGKHTNLIKRKEIWNISYVIFQILVVGFLHLHNAVFQFNKHKRHTIDKDQDIWSSVVNLPLNPHLRYRCERIILRMLKVDQFYKIEIFLAISANGDFSMITNLSV